MSASSPAVRGGAQLSSTGLASFVAQLERNGVRLTLVDGQLMCSGPLSGISEAVARQMLERHDDLVDWLGGRAATDRLQIRPVRRNAEVPLAVPQERIWLLHQLAPASSAYTIGAALRLRGPLSVSAVAHASQALVDRHEALRTVFPIVDGRPVQRVLEGVSVELEQHDLSVSANPERDRDAILLAARLVERPFDLASGPLFRIALIRLGEEEHVLVVSVHHVVSDQWTMGVIGREFAELYEACSEQRPHRLEALPIQYADYSVRHRAWLNGPELTRQLEYWRNRLRGVVPALLPRRPNISAPTRNASGTVDLPDALLQRLRQIGASERATLFMVLLAGFGIVLSRYTGRSGLSVGTPVANRTTREIEALAGTFVNTLVLTFDTGGDPTFRELLRRVRGTALEAFAHQDLSFDRLVAELRPDRAGSRAPYFQVLFNVQNAPLELPQPGGLRAELLVLPRADTQFDLTVSIDTEVDWRLSFTFDPKMFDRDFIEGFFKAYSAVLDQVSRAPGQRIADLELIDAAQRRELVTTWNSTAEPDWTDRTVLQLVAASVAAHRDAVAVACGGSSLTYGELDERSDQLARHLRASGVAPGTLVGICLERSVEVLVALLGVLKAGAAYLPLDPGFPRDRLTLMIEDSGTRLVLTDAPSRHCVAESGAVLVQLDQVLADAPHELHHIELPAVTSAGLAYVLYTSGSTGRPKGIEIEHRSLASFLLSMQREPGLSSTDRLLSVTTLSFDIAALELFLPLVAGASVVIAQRTDVLDPAALASLIEAHKITTMQATPATWRLLLDSGWPGSPQLTMLCGGEALDRDLADRLLARGSALWNLYGPTETTIWSTVDRVQPGAAPISIGRPIANTVAFVVDPQCRPTPVGVPGELLIGGIGVARGYRGRPDLTAERFVPDPFGGRPEGRLYRTGDLARRWPDGRLECLGRLDHQVKVRGFRIELGEVESALVALASVRQGAVIAVADASGESTLAAFVVWERGVEGDVRSVRSELHKRLPPYMVPTRVVPVDALPLTPNGKVDRARLELPTGGGDGNPREMPTSSTEIALARIWSDVLGLPAVGVDNDFFEVGGHSLLAVQLMVRIEAELGRKLALASLFDAPTIRMLARVVEGEQSPSPWVSLVPIQPSGSKPPFFCVHGLGGEVLLYAQLAELCAPDQPFVAIRAPFYDGATAPLRTIEEQAEFYLREIFTYQPEGPYYIGGYSHGGRVALEMALQLERAGHEVGFLGIFDTPPCFVPQPRLRYTWRWLLNLPMWIWYDLRVSGLKANLERVGRALRRAGRRLGLSAQPLVKADVEQIMDLSNLPTEIRAVYQQDFEAFLKYVPNGECGDVTVFRARGQPVFGSHEPDLGWRRASRGRVSIRHFRANHLSLFHEPAVEALATELRSALEAAQEQRRGDRSGPAAGAPGTRGSRAHRPA